ncbi:MAG: type II toxin-antitoxin system VapC family toxin [Halobacteriota archaeon]
MKCLDTDFLVAILRGKNDAKSKMESLDAEGRNATTTINAFELFFGAHKSTKKTKNVREVFKLLDRLDAFDFTLDASEVAGEITAILENEGKMLDFRDIMIASIVKCRGMTLITRNADHFNRIKGLQIEEW